VREPAPPTEETEEEEESRPTSLTNDSDYERKRKFFDCFNTDL
jgi:hypothetical protein